jgi:hypothetical protein
MAKFGMPHQALLARRVRLVQPVLLVLLARLALQAWALPERLAQQE